MQPEKIKELRKKLNMTQEQFARKIGVAYFTIVRWENKMNRPSQLALEKLQTLSELVAKGEN